MDATGASTTYQRETTHTGYSAHLAASDDFMAEAEASDEVYLAIGERMSSGRVVPHTSVWMTWKQASDLCAELAKVLALHGSIHRLPADVTAPPLGTCPLSAETGVAADDLPPLTPDVSRDMLRHIQQTTPIRVGEPIGTPANAETGVPGDDLEPCIDQDATCELDDCRHCEVGAAADHPWRVPVAITADGNYTPAQGGE